MDNRDPENPNQRPPNPNFFNQPYRRLNEEDDIIGQRPSIILPRLQEIEKLFFELVQSGDVDAVNEFLQNNPGFNINCSNFQGIKALLIAVRTAHESMVEALLTHPDIEIGDCVLHAIKGNQVKILEQLLEKIHATAPSLEYVGVTHSSDFADNITPLVLAAQCGHYEIIQMLVERGHTISKPHPPNCRCMECREQLERDDLLHAEQSRIERYKAIANPAYISLSNTDPILFSFQLSVELRQRALLSPGFKTIYQELADDVSNFAVELLGTSRNSGEVELILNQKGGIGNILQYPRLVLAMDYKQKTFVAHSYTQHLVETAWRGSWHEYVLKPVWAKCLYPFTRVLTLPMVLLMLIATPRHPWVMFWNIPLNRMFSHVASYIIFLVLIFLQSNVSKSRERRYPPNSGLEPVIVIFVVGNFWNMFRMCFIQGASRYFRKLWNWHAVTSNCFFILTFIFWLASYVDAKNNDQVDLERKYWNQLDPILLAEGTFAIAVIMSYFKLMFFYRLSYYLGPVQISLGKLCADISKYFAIFLVIILSFTVGMCRYYSYYDSMVQTDSNGIKTAQVSSFTDFTSTLKTFFWAVLGQSSLESADVIIENLPGETENTSIINKHGFTEAVGYVALAIFQVVSVVMIMNMLIATMSNTQQRISDNLDTEWIFGKTDFYLEYMLQSTLPSPLNLIPTPGGISKFMELFQVPRTDLKDLEARNEYPALMSQLVQRYFRLKDDSAMGDAEALKLDVSDLRSAIDALIDNKQE